MKRFALALTLFSLGTTAYAQVHVNGYTRSNGTYVAPHERSAPNSTTYDNYSTKGNTNPYTGQPGTKSPYDNSSPKTSGYNPYNSTSGANPQN